LNIIDAETYTAYREELAQRQANKRPSKKKINQPQKSQSNNRQKRTRSPSIDDNRDSELKENIELPIKEADGCEEEARSVDNRINDQLSRELKGTTESVRLTRIRRLSIRFRDES
jgi:hypothetical protein